MEFAEPIRDSHSQSTAPTVRGVWMRNYLLARHHRLLRLEQTVRKRKIKLSDEQIQALERFDPEYHERHIQVGATGELLAVDTFFAGKLKERWRGLQPDRARLLQPRRLSRLCTSKKPGPGRADPEQPRSTLFEEQGLKVTIILRDRGREYCGRREPPSLRALPAARGDRAPHHPGRKVPVRTATSSGSTARSLEEHLQIKGRTTWYETLEEMQKELGRLS